MIRTLALAGLAVLLVGCMRFQNRGPKKEPPPPYGAVAPKPLDISATPAPPPPPDERSLVPPRSSTPAPAGGAAPDPVAKNLADLKALVATARSAWNNVSTYETTLTRRELNPKGVTNSEVLIFQYRRDPVSVFTRNIGGSGKGRETVYNPGAFEDKLYVMLGEGDNKLMKAGFIAPPVSPDDPRVKEKSRYSIREAGFGRPIAALARTVGLLETGQCAPGAVTFDGEVKRDEFPYPLVGVTHKLAVGDDPLIPTGGARQYFFDVRPNTPSFGLPVLIVARDAAGKEVEYYLAEKVKNPANLTDAHFNPARLGK